MMKEFQPAGLTHSSGLGAPTKTAILSYHMPQSLNRIIIPLIAYVENQAEHHKTETFQNEFRRLLKKYGIDYDERYVWD